MHAVRTVIDRVSRWFCLSLVKSQEFSRGSPRVRSDRYCESESVFVPHLGVLGAGGESAIFFRTFSKGPPVLLRTVRECGGRLAWGENDSPHQRHDCLWRDLTDLSRSSSVAANVKLHLAPGQLCCGNVRRFNPSQQTLGTKVHDEAFLFSIYKPLPLPMVV